MLPFLKTLPSRPGFLEQAAGFDSADLIYRQSRFWLHVIVTLPEVEFQPSGDVVGVDLGLNRPAVCSDNRFLGKKYWREIDRRYFRLKRAHAQLRAFLSSKAEAGGCRVVGVDPRHTSQMCSRCGHVHRSNRRSQSRFVCRACGFELNADLNGARNIARKYLASGGMTAAGGPLSTGLSC